MSDILQLLNFGTIVINLGGLAALAYFVYRATRRFTNLERDVEENKQGLAETRADLKDFINEVKAEFKEVRMELRGFSDRLAVVETTLKAIPYMHTSSPLVLNESGKEVARAIDADGIAERYAHKVKLPKDANAFNIQEACFEYAKGDLLGAMKKEDRQRVELYTFDAGDNISHVKGVIGLKLRDVILKEKGLFTKKLEASNVED